MKQKISFVMIVTTAASLGLVSPNLARAADGDDQPVYILDGSLTVGGAAAAGFAGHEQRKRNVAKIDAKAKMEVEAKKAGVYESVHSGGSEGVSQPGRELADIQLKINNLRQDIAKSQGEAAGAKTAREDLMKMQELEVQAAENALSNHIEHMSKFGARTGMAQSSTLQTNAANNMNESGMAGGFPGVAQEHMNVSGANTSLATQSSFQGPGVFGEEQMNTSIKAGLESILKGIKLRSEQRVELRQLAEKEANAGARAKLLEEQLARLNEDMTTVRKIELSDFPAASAKYEEAESLAKSKVMTSVAIGSGAIAAAAAVQGIYLIESNAMTPKSSGAK